MKTSVAIVVSILLLIAAASAQGSFVTLGPESPVDFGQVNLKGAWVQGHWVALDAKSRLTGPSVSTLSCDKAAQTCTDQNANISAYPDGSFTLSGDSDEYTIERWDAQEIVASRVQGICRVRSVLKFDLVTKRIFSSETLSEPVNGLPKLSQSICDAVGMNLELKSNAVWKYEDAAQDAVKAARRKGCEEAHGIYQEGVYPNWTCSPKAEPK